MEHFKMVCKICNKVISQCRCMDCNKTIKYSVCMACSDKEMDKVKSEPMNRKEAIKIAERESKELKRPSSIVACPSGGVEFETEESRNIHYINTGIDSCRPLLADKIMENANMKDKWIKICLDEQEPLYKQIVVSERKNKELQQKLDRAERALLIESSEPEERSQEASHYNWLDDKNEELQQKLDRMEKELVEEKYLNDMASQAKTMT